MADLQSTTARASPRIDFTPMVDLGFLLITFFMLTTVLAKPNVMAVVIPDRDPMPSTQPAISESQVLTLLLGDNNQIYAYEGFDTAPLDTTDYANLRHLLLDKKQRVQAEWGTENHRGQPISKLTVFIKPTPQANYANVVNALDEMKICHIGHYLLLDPTEPDLQRLTPASPPVESTRR